MKRQDVPVKNLKVKIINIVLYPQEEQKKENYISLLKQIFDDKKTIKTFGERYTRIRTFYISEDRSVIHGDFSNAIFFDPKDNALDRNTNKIIPSGTDPNKGLGLKTWEYYFFPEHHRLVFIESESSESQILKFLNTAFSGYLDEDSFQINTEKDQEIIDRIVHATALSKLYIRVSYSNNDNNKGWKGLIDSQLRKSKSKTASLDLSATKKAPIDVTQSEMITGFVELSASNGYAEASEIGENGAIQHIKTAEHPMVRVVQYTDDPTLALKGLVKSIASEKNDNIPERLN